MAHKNRPEPPDLYSSGSGSLPEIDIFIPEKWSEWHPDEVFTCHDNVAVFKAVRDDVAGQSCSVIKLLRVLDDTLRAKRIEEIKTMLSLKGHPNIVSIEDYTVEKKDGLDFVFIRMELLTPLDRYVAANDFSEEDSIRLGMDICDALEHCRKNKILHLDIKPGNIFRTDDGHYKLGDFGISRHLDSLESEPVKDYTAEFMAPELYRSLMKTERSDSQHSRLDEKYDQYSLGLVLYWIHNNRMSPFLQGGIITKQAREDAVKRRLEGTPIPKPAAVSEGLGAVILKACEYDPHKRFRDPAAMKSALKKLSGETSGRSRGLYLAAIAALLVCVAVLVFRLAAPNGTIPVIGSPTDYGQCGESLYWKITGNELRISGTGEMFDYDAGNNPAPWAEHRDGINSLVVEEGVTRIGKYALFESPVLTEVKLPQSLRRINRMAFGYCYSLPSLVIPEGVEHIEESIVYRCPGLTRIELPGTIKLIEGAFAGECESLSTITLGKDCTAYTLKDGVLFDYSMEELICHPAGLDDLSYSVPGTVRTIGVYAFAENKNLREITIPDGLITIDSCAFTGCRNLRSINLPESIVTLGIYAFYDCEKLASIQLPSRIAWIDQQAFYNCYSLQEIVVPSKVTRIGTAVFGYCPSLSKVVIPPSVTSISDMAFENSLNVVIFCEHGSYAEQYAIDQNIPYQIIGSDDSGWSEWSETRMDSYDPQVYQEESRIAYRWWAAQCTKCGTNNPYHGKASYCHGCGRKLANDQGLWTSVFAYSMTTEGTLTIFGRENGKNFDGLPYWLESKQVTQYRYREIPND